MELVNNVKKIIFLILTFTIFISCSNCMLLNDSDYPCFQAPDRITAQTENYAETKTSLNSDLNILWSENDDIAAFIHNTLRERYVIASNSAGTSDGIFNRYDEYDNIGSSTSISNNIAVYPYGQYQCTYDGASSYQIDNFYISDWQEYKKDSFGNNIFPMIAVSSDDTDVNFKFKNICGVIDIRLKGTGIVTQIEIIGNNNELLSGPAIINVSTDNRIPFIRMAEGSYKNIYLYCGGIALNENEPTSFMISLPPTTFTKGFSVRITDNRNKTIIVSTDKINEVKRSAILEMPTIEILSFDVDFDGNIIFSNNEIKESCISNYDTNKDNELSLAEAAAVTDLSELQLPTSIYSFDEFQFFTSITEVPSNLFAGTNIKSIILPDSITTIKNNAFNSCKKLTNILIPENVKTIGHYAFQSCSNLYNINIPESVDFIGEYAFSSSGLYGITLPQSLYAIWPYTFSDCKNLQSITIPESVSSIKDNAFSNCTSLTTINIPKNLTSINNGVFSNCYKLENIYIPNKVTSIGDWAFENCYGLTQLIIPNSVKSIGRSAFHSCWNLFSVIIPDSVTTIGNYAFCTTTKLSSLVIPDSITHIGNFAFCWSGLKEITIPDSIISIEEGTFQWCSELTSISIPNSITSIGVHAFEGCSKLLNIIVPDSVSIIGDYAFFDCLILSTVEIGSGITSIGGSAFKNCPELECIYIKSTTTPDLWGWPFDDELDSIYVPINVIDSYKNEQYWSQHTNIIFGYEY